MIKKTILAAFIIFAAISAQTANIYSQDDNPGSIKIVIPDISIGNSDGYDYEGYDKYGYDRQGYNREGYS